MRNLIFIKVIFLSATFCFSPANADDIATRELINVFTNCDSRGAYDRVPELIEKGADVNAYGCCGYRYSGRGSERTMIGVVMLASDKTCNSNLYNPIHHLLRSENVDEDTALSTLRLLLRAGADPKKPEYDSKGVKEKDFPFTSYGRLSLSSVNSSNAEKKITFLKELVGAGMVMMLRNQSIGAVERYPQPFYDYMYSVAPPEFKKQMDERLGAVRAVSEERVRINLEKEAARKVQEEQENKARQAREAQERIEQQQRETYVAHFRKKVYVGDDTHCGMVIERKDTIIKIQTVVGERWLKIGQIFPPGMHSCRFYNGQYVD